MTTPKIMILGGYGNTGRLMAEFLLQRSPANIVIAGRDGDSAGAFGASLGERFPGRVSAAGVDAGDFDALCKALEGIDLLAVASSTSQFAEQVARACIAMGVDYFDVQYSADKVKTLRALSDEITHAGRMFITDGGFHPGLPAVLVRYAAARMEALESANVGSVIKIDWRGLRFSPATLAEMVGEFSDFDTHFFKNGAWKRGRMDIVVDFLRMDFGPPFGRQICMPMLLEEMRGLPALIPTLRETGFFVGGFNWFTDWIMMPLVMVWLRLFPSSSDSIGRGLLWSLQTFSRPPFGTRLKLESRGVKDGKDARLELTLAHADGYVLTAAPAAAAILQWLDGSIHRAGLYTQGEVVEPIRLLADMQAVGIIISESVTTSAR